MISLFYDHVSFYHFIYFPQKNISTSSILPSLYDINHQKKQTAQKEVSLKLTHPIPT